MDLSRIDNIGESDLRNSLTKFLKRYHEPAFGALPKRETDLLVFSMICELGIIDKEATAYSLMRDLKVTRTKAMQLLFDYDIRERGDNSTALDEEVRKAIKSINFTRDGNWIVLEVENPLVRAHLKNMVQQARHVSDSSFSPTVVKLTPEALTAVLGLLWREGLEREIDDKLRSNNLITEKTWKRAISASLKHLARRAVGEGADIAFEKIGDGFDSLINDNIDGIINFIESCFATESDKTSS